MIHVSWTTPMMRAAKTLDAAAEAIEFRRREQAHVKIREHLRHVRDLIETMKADEAKERHP